jgi:hypothetical protein
MSAAKVLPIERDVLSPSCLPTEELASIVISAFAKIAENLPYILELRKRFAEAPRGNANIAGCKTWEDFCSKHLHRTPRTVQRALRTPDVSCPDCGESFESNSKLKKHQNRTHSQHQREHQHEVSGAAPASTAPVVQNPFAESGNSPPKLNWQDHWHGMPKFEQTDQTSWGKLRVLLANDKQLHVHFRNDEDLQSFEQLVASSILEQTNDSLRLGIDVKCLGDLIGQKLSERTPSCWFPKKEPNRYADKRWVTDSPVNPKYPVYIISKGRWNTPLTARALTRMGVPFKIVVRRLLLDCKNKTPAQRQPGAT